MIWHIVRKDLRLFWWLALLVAVIYWVNLGLLGYGGPFAATSDVVGLGRLAWVSYGVLPSASLLGLVALAIAVIHADRPRSGDQDWVVRPIRRSELLLSKFAFLLLAAVLPMLLGDVVAGKAAGLPTGAVVLGALGHGLAVLTLIAIPAVVIAVFIRSPLHAIPVIAVMLLTWLAAAFGLDTLGIPVQLRSTSLQWQIMPVLAVWAVVVGATILPWRFARRHSAACLWVAIGLGLAVPLAAFRPWLTAFALQQVVSRPLTGAVIVTQDLARQATWTTEALGKYTTKVEPDSTISIPLSFKGLSPTDLVRQDGVVVSIAADNGEVLYRQSKADDYSGARTLVDPSEAGHASTAGVQFAIPTSTLDVARRRHAHLDLTIHMTDLRRGPRYPVDVETGRAQRLESAVCRAQPNRDDYYVLNCVGARPNTDCFAVFTDTAVDSQDALSGTSDCGSPDYSPVAFPLWGEALYRYRIVGITPRVRPGDGEPTDPDGSATKRPPVRAIAVYRPRAHWSTHLQVPLAGLTERWSYQRATSVDGIGAAAQFVSPGAMVVDSHGNVFVVDTQDHVIRRVTPAGLVSTFAGLSGERGWRDGTGATARFGSLDGLAIDRHDNLYVTDRSAGMIRKITPAGSVTTIAGANHARDIVDGAGVQARFYAPSGIAVDAGGNILVTEQGGEAPYAEVRRRLPASVRRIAPDGTVSTLAGPKADPVKR